jgi:oligoribonuclease
MKKLLWTDIETTGLHDSAEILALGMVVTDGDLNVLAEFEQHINPKGKASNLDLQPEARRMHEKSGLLARCDAAPFNLAEVETLARAFVIQHGGEKPFMAGSTVHFDSRHLRRHMPKVVELCHYRMLDVSVFKVLGEAWDIADWVKPPCIAGETAHTPIADIRGSIEMLRWYRQNALVVLEPGP